MDAVKYLGVKISKDLRWKAHISHITAKANSTLGFIRRNIDVNNPFLKAQAYKSLVRPILEYSQTVWDPYTETETKQLEAVQRRAARMVLNRYRNTSSVGAMMTQLQWRPLAERRETARLVMFHKIHYQLVVVIMPLTIKTLTTSRRFNSLSYNIPSTRVDYYKDSFFPRTARAWNLLPQEVVTLATPEAFRRALVA